MTVAAVPRDTGKDHILVDRLEVIAVLNQFLG